MRIGSWECEELYPGTDYTMRTAKKGSVEFIADESGISVEEASHGYCGYTGTYGIPANVLMWLAQAVRL